MVRYAYGNVAFNLHSNILVDVVPQIPGRLRWSLLSPPCLTIFHIFHIAAARLVWRSLEDDAFELIQWIKRLLPRYCTREPCLGDECVTGENRLIWSHKWQLLGQSTKSGSLEAIRYSIRISWSSQDDVETVCKYSSYSGHCTAFNNKDIVL